MAPARPACGKLFNRPMDYCCPVGTPWGLVSPQVFTKHLVIPGIGLSIMGNPGIYGLGFGALARPQFSCGNQDEPTGAEVEL